MISYAGIELVIPQDADAAARLQDFVRIEEIEEFESPRWTGVARDWGVPDYAPMRPVRLGRLYWPRGASRWATAHLLVNEDQLDRIRRLCYTGDSRGVIPRDLVIDDGNGGVITAPMLITPPRPLFQWDTLKTGANSQAATDTSGNIYLLTLVDDRYFWRRKSSAFTISAGTTTWTQLYASIATSLGITITVDAIPSAYLKPSADLTSKYHDPALLLDAVAYSVGQRIVRYLDGTVVAQNPVSGRAADAANVLAFRDKTQAGGTFRLDRLGAHSPHDMPALIPDTVRVILPLHPATDTDAANPCSTTHCGEWVYASDITVYDLNSATFDYFRGGITFARGYKTFRTSAIAWIATASSSSSSSSGAASVSLSNSAEVAALTRQLAKDWYLWQASGDQHRMISGIVAWDHDGANDFVEWEAFPMLRTRISREPMNDLATYVFHQATAPTSSSSSSGSSSSGSSSGSPSSSGVCCNMICGWTNLTGFDNTTDDNFVKVDRYGCLFVVQPSECTTPRVINGGTP